MLSFADVVNFLPEAICILDHSHKFEFVNKVFERNVCSLQRGSNYVFEEDLVHPDDKPLFLAALSEAANGLSASCKSLRTLTTTGSNDFPIFRRYNWLLNGELGEGKIILSGRMVTVVDGEEDVEGEFLDFFQRAPIALHWLSGTGHILWANDTELQVLGYTAEEYIGQPVMKFCPDEEELVLEIFKQLGSGNTIKDVPVRFRAKNGSIKHLLIDSNVNWNDDGTFRHTRCFIRDDTGRKIKDAIGAAEKATATRTATAIDGCLRRVIHQIRKQLYQAQDIIQSLSGDSWEKNLRLVEGQMDRMMGNLDDLAFATMCENGHVVALKPVLLQLDLMIRNIFAKLAYNRRDGQKVELDLRLGDAPNDVLVDASITRVLHHLISNAITYSPDVSVVLVEVSFTPAASNRLFSNRRVLRMNDGSQRRGIFTFQVINNVTRQMDLDAVYSSFQKYYSLGTSPRPSSELGGGNIQQGLGIGLNVAYNMIQMMGGNLDCSATPLESVFAFSLDLAYDTPGSAGRSDNLPLAPFSITKRVASPRDDGESKWTTVQESKIAEHYIRQDNKDDTDESAPEAIKLNCFDRKRRILVVDDSTICQRVLAKVMKRLNLDCVVASNGREAIDLLRPEPLVFDAVLMDIQMPIMDGLTAIRMARQELHLTIPIIVLTADVGEESREEVALQAGANSYLCKPASMNEIKTALRKANII